MRFILASGSESRRRLLTAAGVPFTAMPSPVDEDDLKRVLTARQVPVADMAVHIARAKAKFVSAQHRDALVLGADQTLIFEGELVSKCGDLAEARALLARLRGRTHRLIGGYVLTRNGAEVWHHSETAELTMRNFSDRFLDRYLAEEGNDVLSAVGCYKLEGLGAQLFERVAGDYFAVLGLSLQPLLAELRRQGVLDT